MRSQSTSSISPKLASTIGSAYSVWGLWGTCFRFLASIFLELQIISTNIQWLITLEHAPPPTRRLLTIERTQGWLMLVFSPLQQFSFLRMNDLVPAALPLPTPSGKWPSLTARSRCGRHASGWCTSCSSLHTCVKTAPYSSSDNARSTS